MELSSLSLDWSDRLCSSRQPSGCFSIFHYSSQFVVFPYSTTVRFVFRRCNFLTFTFWVYLCNLCGFIYFQFVNYFPLFANVRRIQKLRQLTIGLSLACVRWVMGGRGRLLSTRDEQESHEAIAECDSRVSGAQQVLKCIHNSTDAR